MVAVFQSTPRRHAQLEKKVNEERDRRIEGGFIFMDYEFQSGRDSRENIQGATTNAMLALMNGAQSGDLYWHGADTPFVFLTRDNTPVPMDAQTAVLFGQTAAKHKSQMIFAARALKDMSRIPDDYTDDKYWIPNVEDTSSGDPVAQD